MAGDGDDLAHFEQVAAERDRVQPWMDEVFRFADFAGKKVLEVGIGLGTDLARFAAAGAECHGVDITDRHIELARRNMAARGLGADIRRADAAALPYGDGTFQAVYSFGVLHHVPDIAPCIAEVRRVLAPGGVFLVALYHTWSAFHLFRKVLTHGIGRGDLFRLGYRGLMATTEAGADGRAIRPYVKTYSRTEVARLLRDFRETDILVRQLWADHFDPLTERLIPARLVERLDGVLGWYVVAIARK